MFIKEVTQWTLYMIVTNKELLSGNYKGFVYTPFCYSNREESSPSMLYRNIDGASVHCYFNGFKHVSW